MRSANDHKVRAWLKALARNVAHRLVEISARQPHVIRIMSDSQIVPYLSDTDGYSCAVARLPSDRAGYLELWLDEFAGAGRPILYYGYASDKAEKIKAVTQCGEAWAKPATRRPLAALIRVRPGIYQMKRPLPRSKYNSSVTEVYGGRSYFGVYDSSIIKPELPPSERLTKLIATFLFSVARQVAAVSAQVDLAVTEKKVLRTHLVRERSAAKALLCKQRDHFTCQICGINFGALYGALGEGIADAHHLRPLASQPDRTKTQLRDLITVCPNCHRVLHSPKAGGNVQKVKRAFTRNWPD